MTYDKKDFEAVVEAVDIKKEIELRIGALKKAGSNYQDCCPFHSEKTPSFTISPTKKIWKCFGCGEQGDVISFVSKYDQISQMEAMRKLAKENGITVAQIEKEEEGVTNLQQAYTALKVAQVTFESELLRNKTAKRYIVERGIDTALLVKHWGLGWAGSQYDLQADQKGKEIAGLTKEGRLFFRNRLMFPIQDITGRIVGFGGRDLSGASKAKYINTQDTPLYHKSKVLYGLHQAIKHIKKSGICIITEGYFDVIMLHQVKGLEKAVAPCGTSLTKEQAAILAKHAAIAMLMFDGDKPGQKATIRAIESLIAVGFKKIEVSVLPDGVDAADLILDCNRDLSLFIDNVENVDGFHFLYKNIEGDDETKIKAILKMIANCPSPLRRDLYIRELADNSKFSQYTLIDELAILLRRKAWA